MAPVLRGDLTAQAIAKLVDPWSTKRYVSGPTLAGFTHSA